MLPFTPTEAGRDGCSGAIRGCNNQQRQRQGVDVDVDMDTEMWHSLAPAVVHFVDIDAVELPTRVERRPAPAATAAAVVITTAVATTKTAATAASISTIIATNPSVVVAVVFVTAASTQREDRAQRSQRVALAATKIEHHTAATVAAISTAASV